MCFSTSLNEVLMSPDFSTHIAKAYKCESVQKRFCTFYIILLENKFEILQEILSTKQFETTQGFIIFLISQISIAVSCW